MPEVVYESVENSHAKNITMDAIEKELEAQGFDSSEFDLIDLSDVVVEALLAAGMKVPEDLFGSHED